RLGARVRLRARLTEAVAQPPHPRSGGVRRGRPDGPAVDLDHERQVLVGHRPKRVDDPNLAPPPAAVEGRDRVAHEPVMTSPPSTPITSPLMKPVPSPDSATIAAATS